MPTLTADLNLPVANAVWIGNKLGPVHAMCFRSFILAGHRLRLHCFSPPSDVPDGVEIADARALMSEDRIVRYRKGGSYSLFSNLFRLMILKAGLGLYVDCDVFCLRPIPDNDYIFGFENSEFLNGAVLKLPSDSEMMRGLSAIATDPDFVAPWFRPRKRAWLAFRKAMGFPAGIQIYRWGDLGPIATTYYARQAGVIGKAAPAEVFYPVSHDRAQVLLEPGLSLGGLVTDRTLTVHLYNEKLRAFLSQKPIPPDSPLGQMFMRCDLPIPA
jgi:hypothetical protein